MAKWYSCRREVNAPHEARRLCLAATPDGSGRCAPCAEVERAERERRARWPFWPGAEPAPGVPILDALAGRSLEPELPGAAVPRQVPAGQIPARAEQADPGELLSDFRQDPELQMFFPEGP